MESEQKKIALHIKNFFVALLLEFYLEKKLH